MAAGRVERARDGVEALNLVERVEPELVLTDIMMPRKDGLDVCRTLKNRPETAELLEVSEAEQRRIGRELHDRVASHLSGTAMLAGELVANAEAERQARSGTADCRFEYDGPSIDLTAEVSSNLYRIAEEAVHNAVRHGNDTQITIRLQHSREDLILTVQDDGSGFEPAQIEEGLGLRTMRYRADQLEARLTVESSGENGAAVQVRMPT